MLAARGRRAVRRPTPAEAEAAAAQRPLPGAGRARHGRPVPAARGRLDTVAELTGADGWSWRAPGTCRWAATRSRSTRHHASSSTGSPRRPPPRTRGPGRVTAGQRVLYLSSPIGLGHVRRDLAIADALREQRPDLEVEWLTQSPVTEFLEQQRRARAPGLGATWPASRRTSSREAGEHDLHAFQAIRRMDEILVNNFMVFDDLVDAGARTTCGSATRPGTSTTSCTRTRSSSARRSPG